MCLRNVRKVWWVEITDIYMILSLFSFIQHATQRTNRRKDLDDEARTVGTLLVSSFSVSPDIYYGQHGAERFYAVITDIIMIDDSLLHSKILWVSLPPDLAGSKCTYISRTKQSGKSEVELAEIHDYRVRKRFIITTRFDKPRLTWSLLCPWLNFHPLRLYPMGRDVLLPIDNSVSVLSVLSKENQMNTFLLRRPICGWTSWTITEYSLNLCCLTKEII